MKMQLLKKIW